MTVTELRQALEKLEAEGKGGLPVFIDVSTEYFYQPQRISVGTYIPPAPLYDADGNYIRERPTERAEAAIFDDTGMGPYGYGDSETRDTDAPPPQPELEKFGEVAGNDKTGA